MKELETKLKLESIEKRLDNIERMLYSTNGQSSSGNSGINQELLMMLMEMVRRDARGVAPVVYPPPATTTAAQVQAAPHVAPEQQTVATTATTDSFEMFRRRTVI